MKKFLTLFFAFIFSVCIIQTADAFDIDGLYNNYQAVYMPSTKTWANAGMAEDRIVLTKKTTEGSGNYSQYFYSNGKLAIALKSNFEFINGGRLIGVDNAGLKYYEIKYDKKSKKFSETLLSNDSLKEIFPDAEIVNISQFNNNEITIKKQIFNKKTILLVNDTDKYFHKYSYKPLNVMISDVKGLIRINHIGKIRFSLYGDKENMLTINVKNTIK